ncbi:TrmH family RNA methyltransferase [Terriglobus aquaticus]|uniref:TrmH family RNA methyltransferase n=1 Tax=Terriglobus aquaticus TaxID=940139 RepID=A0ABW9KK84_9BACT|nr:RNA methyltransferase [Terriglobus aquaticus]
MPAVITSRQNSRVRALRAALAGRGEDGAIGVESPHLVREALQTHEAEVLAVFVREDRTELLADLPAEIEQVVLSREVFASVAATEHSQGMAALVTRPTMRFLPRPGQLLLLLDKVQDPGNVGTLVRSAEAFGAAAVLATEGTADVWNGKALRASAGAAFRMPVVRWSETLRAAVQKLGTRMLAAVADEDGALAATDANLGGGCVLVIGNEGRGVSPELLAVADGRITLPMAGPTESLNAAVAGSVLLYEAARQRRAGAR